MKQCKLIIRDEVNIKFDGLDPPIRRKLEKANSAVRIKVKNILRKIEKMAFV